MGAGGSIDTGLASETDNDRYFCHGCHSVFTLGAGVSPVGASCPSCYCETLEELNSISRGQNLYPARRNSRGRFSNMFGNHEVSDAQTQRVTTAATMLRLLESQLREELEQLQFAFETAHMRMGADLRNAAQPVPKAKFTKIMLGKLRTIPLDVDTVCSQPSCPICSEDFAVDNCETKLPCSHIFHRACVLPWLEMKQNCPICRTCITDEIPSLIELEKLSMQDLSKWLNLMRGDCDYADICAQIAGKPEGKSGSFEHTESAENEGQIETRIVTVKDDGTTNERSAIAAELQQELMAYQRDVIATEAAAERRQQQENARNFLVQNARMQEHLDGQLRDYLNFSPGGHSERLLLASDNNNSMQLSRARSSPPGMTGFGSREGPTSPGISGALRRGLYGHGAPINNVTNHASALMYAGMNARSGPPYPSIAGSTRLSNGLEVRHQIRLVEDASDSDSGDEQSARNVRSELDRVYQAANESHLAQFGVGGLPGMHALSDYNAPTHRQVGNNASSNAVMREFNRSLHPELDLLDDERAPAFLRNLSTSMGAGSSSQQEPTSADLVNSLTSLLNRTDRADEHSAHPTQTRGRTYGMSEIDIDSYIANPSGFPSRSARSVAQSDPDSRSTSERLGSNRESSTRGAGVNEGTVSPHVIGTTYQVRSAGAGTYATYPVTFSNDS